MKSPSTAVAGGGAARSLLTARAWWTMDSPTEGAMASESTCMWCVAKSRVASIAVPTPNANSCDILQQISWISDDARGGLFLFREFPVCVFARLRLDFARYRVNVWYSEYRCGLRCSVSGVFREQYRPVCRDRIRNRIVRRLSTSRRLRRSGLRCPCVSGA